MKIHGYGNTRNKRYKVISSWVESEVESSDGLNVADLTLLFNAVQHDIYKYHETHNKPIDNLTEFCRQRVLDWEETLGFDIDHRLFDKVINSLQGMYPAYVLLGFAIEITDNDAGGFIGQNAPEHWFVPGNPFVGSAYIGFQGCDFLKTVINNIVRNIDFLGDDILDELYYGSQQNVNNIHFELKWLINNKRSRLEQHKNKIAITLALLHLNRSLMEDFAL